MALNIYSMEMNDQVYKGMGEFVDFLVLARPHQAEDPAG